MKKAFLICLFLAVVLPAGSVETARSWTDFYLRTSRYGEMGIVRQDWGGKLAVSTLIPGQALSVPQVGDRRFVFNHYMRNPTREVPAVTYVAVLLFLAYRPDQTPGKPSLVVHRNSGWWRQFCPARRPSCFAQAGESHQFFEPNLAEMARRDHLQGNVEVLDAHLNRKYHGYPIPAADLDSWEQRRFFAQAPRDDPMCNRPGYRCVVEYQLLRFSPTRTPYSTARVEFHANTWSIEGASIYVYSPEESFGAHYNVNFSRP